MEQKKAVAYFPEWLFYMILFVAAIIIILLLYAAWAGKLGPHFAYLGKQAGTSII
ncbi:MAG: hypothetical protein HY438_02755 [DPANN group archaeon]|nr:hypothetical protein [DPANN group archaeon]